MPVDPHSWNDNQDYLTARYLNDSLTRYAGQEFTPTGSVFHARRPVYKSYASPTLIPTAVSTATWSQAYENGASPNVSSPVADTGGTWGAWMDPYTTGNINLRLNGGGGLPGSQGGLVMAVGNAVWPATNDGSYAAAIGNANSTVDTYDGTIQAFNSTVQGSALVLDILDGNNTNRYALLTYNGSSIPVTPAVTASTDGSGSASRFHAHWVSVYPANGFTVPSVPNPATSWTSASALNATLLNGNAGIRDVIRYLNMPPLLRAVATGGQSMAASTANVMAFTSSTYDTYGAFSANTSTYTVPRTGLYLIYVLGTSAFAAAELRCGVNINGTFYWGPRAGPMSGAVVGDYSCAKAQIFALQAGDTIQPIFWPSANTTLSSFHDSKFIVLQVANVGPPAVSVTAPDTSYRWAAGTPGPLDSIFNAHVANDLVFLSRRPYMLSYQSAAQTGIAMNAATTVVMDKAQGIIHGETGTNADNYSGFNTGTGIYTAQRAGWYMCVWEIFLANPSLTTSPYVTAAISPTPSGNTSWDTYQRQNMALTGQYPGATGITYYYLRAGDTIKPGVVTGNSSSTTISTAVTSGINSHFELVWLGE